MVLCPGGTGQPVFKARNEARARKGKARAYALWSGANVYVGVEALSRKLAPLYRKLSMTLADGSDGLLLL